MISYEGLNDTDDDDYYSLLEPVFAITKLSVKGNFTRTKGDWVGVLVGLLLAIPDWGSSLLDLFPRQVVGLSTLVQAVKQLALSLSVRSSLGTT